MNEFFKRLMKGKNTTTYEIIIKKNGEPIEQIETDCAIISVVNKKEAVQKIHFAETDPVTVAACICGVMDNVKEIYKRHPELKFLVSLGQLGESD